MDLHAAAEPSPHAMAAIEPTGLWARLKEGTREVHGRLDMRIGEGNPFESAERYGMFLLVQHDFHSIVSPLYQHAEMAPLLPDLKNRDRLPDIEQDLADLGIAVPARSPASVPYSIDIPTSLGWLYVAEGSNLGAAFLLKWAKEKLSLSETHGARHLAPAAEGRGLHWKTFTAAIDAIPFSPEEEARVIAGANEAFARVASFVEARYFAK